MQAFSNQIKEKIITPGFADCTYNLPIHQGHHSAGEWKGLN